jgi:hypothetical protein
MLLLAKLWQRGTTGDIRLDCRRAPARSLDFLNDLVCVCRASSIVDDHGEPV